MTPIDLSLLIQCHRHAMQHRAASEGCVYLWGAKPDPAADSADIAGSDCSGYVRWLIARATNQALILPEGSVGQHQWCKDQNLPGAVYDRDALVDGKLYIAFIAPRTLPSGKIVAGHVWCINDGWSIECHGGVGVDSRPWNHPHLIGGVCACYELAIQ